MSWGRRFARGSCLVVFATATASGQGSEKVGKIELANGYLSVDARSDGLLVVSLLNTLHFDFGSGIFSPRTVSRWLESVERTIDSLKTANAQSGSTPVLMGADRQATMDLNFRLSASPSIVSVRIQRPDGVGLVVSGIEGDSSLALLLGFLRTAAERTVTLTLASPDSVRVNFSDEELTQRTTRIDSVRAHPPEKWGTIDRLFVISGSALAVGAGASYGTGKVILCGKETLCFWRFGNTGFVIGSGAGATFGSMLFAWKSPCPWTKRLGRTVSAVMLGGMPGLLLAGQRKEPGLSLVTLGQAIAADLAMLECRISG